MEIKIKSGYGSKLIIEITDYNTTISDTIKPNELRDMLLDILKEEFSEKEILDAWGALRDEVRAEIERECVR